MDRILCFMLIFFGGGLGCLCRFLLDGNEHSPFSVSNFCACILIGISYSLLCSRIWFNNKFIISFVNVGFLGGLSTFAPLAIYALQSHDGMLMKLFSMLGYLLAFWLVAGISAIIAKIALDTMIARRHSNEVDAVDPPEEVLLMRLPSPGKTGRLLMFYEGYQQQLAEVVQEVEQLKELFASLKRPLNRPSKQKDKLEEQRQQVIKHIVECFSTLLTCSLELRICVFAIDPTDNHEAKTPYPGLELFFAALKKQGFLGFETYTVRQSIELYEQWAQDFDCEILLQKRRSILLGLVSQAYMQKQKDPTVRITNTVSYFFFLKSCVQDGMKLFAEVHQMMNKRNLSKKQLEAFVNKNPFVIFWAQRMVRADVL